MNQPQFNKLLRNAVIAALPLAGTVSCVATEAKPEPETIKKTDEAHDNREEDERNEENETKISSIGERSSTFSTNQEDLP